MKKNEQALASKRRAIRVVKNILNSFPSDFEFYVEANDEKGARDMIKDQVLPFIKELNLKLEDIDDFSAFYLIFKYNLGQELLDCFNWEQEDKIIFTYLVTKGDYLYYMGDEAFNGAERIRMNKAIKDSMTNDISYDNFLVKIAERIEYLSLFGDETKLGADETQEENF